MLTSGKESYEVGDVIFEEGSLLNLEFNLPNSDQVIHTKGKVAWARSKDTSDEKTPPGMGIEFVDMKPDDKKLLDKYIALVKSS